MFCLFAIVQLKVQDSELKKTSKIWLDSNLGIRQPRFKSPDEQLHFLFLNFLMYRKLQDKTNTFQIHLKSQDQNVIYLLFQLFKLLHDKFKIHLHICTVVFPGGVE